MTKPKHLHLESGHPVSNDVVRIKGDRFRFVDDENRTIFEIVSYQHYIEVRSVEFHSIGDSIHGGGILIAPRAGNSIELHTQFYSKKKGGQA